MRSIELKSLTHHWFTKYARVTDRTVADVVDEALNFWIDTNGEPMLNFLERKETKKRRAAGTTGRLVVFQSVRKSRKI
jgi:hypothetical protein